MEYNLLKWNQDKIILKTDMLGEKWNLISNIGAKKNKKTMVNSFKNNIINKET